MNSNDILNMKCSTFKNIINSKEPYSVDGLTIGEFITGKSKQLTEACNIIKSEKKHSFRYDKIKRENIPCATLSCTCTQRNAKYVITRNPIIVLDIDYDEEKSENLFLKENKDNVKHLLIQLPYVVAVDDSCSGTGIYAIVLLASNKDDDELREYYNSLEKTFFENYRIKLDPACKDVVRLRVASDSEPIIKQGEVIPYTDKLKTCNTDNQINLEDIPCDRIIKRRINTHRINTYNNDSDNKEEILKIVIYKLLDKGYSTDSYRDWIRDMYYLKSFGNDGYSLMVDISKNSLGFTNENNVLSQWNKIPEINTKDDAYKHYFGVAKQMLGKGYYKNIIDELNKNKEDKNEDE